MAKSARASCRKASKSKLRRTLHGPNEEARIQRLSVKLLEIAASNKPVVPASTMEVDEDASKYTENNLEQEQVKGKMDLDQAPAQGLRKKKSIRKHSRGKSRSSVVFPGTLGRKKGFGKRK